MERGEKKEYKVIGKECKGVYVRELHLDPSKFDFLPICPKN